MSRNLPPLLLALAVLLMQAGPAATDPAPGVVTITITGPKPVATTDSTAAATAPAAGARISASYTHTCGVTDAGRAKCWGHNFSGELGDGTTDPHKVPRAVSGLTSGVAAVETGWSHTCALTDAGGVMCWGENYYGQLGDRTGIDHHTPVSVRGLTSGVTAITAGGEHTCALTEAGGAMCWGANYYGQLGNGTKKRGRQPLNFVSGLTSGVAAVAARGAHTCALTTAGAVKCWGSNRYGQLGDGTTETRLTPVAVSGLASGMIAIAAGHEHNCALTEAGGVMCWGHNRSGELGDGTKTDRLTPVSVSGLTMGVTAIAAGGSHTCALTEAGGVKCWGYNGNGQIGDGSVDNRRKTPVSVSGLTSGVAAIATGYLHSCALTAAGVAKCWGWNATGQLGDGTTKTRLTPVDVVGFQKRSPEAAADIPAGRPTVPGRP